MTQLTARAQALAQFRATFGREPEFVVRAPGRVNLLGEHVDYNEGWVLPAALGRAVWVAVARHPVDELDVCAADVTPARVRVPLATLAPETAATYGWAAYPAGVAWALREAGYAPCGLQASVASDVPIGAGLSSSAAIETAFAWAWRRVLGLALVRTEIARLCQRAENAYVGVACGIMDQFTVACGVVGQALCLDCRTLAYDPVPVPPGVAIVIADSKASRKLAGSEYNKRRAECEEGMRLIGAHLPGARALRDVSLEEFVIVQSLLPDTIRRRCRHVVYECARVLSGVEHLRRGDAAAFGAEMRASHDSLRMDYKVSSRELDALVDAACAVPGCYGSRLTGAGFGGCTVSLVADGAVEGFIAQVGKAYLRATGLQAELYVEHASAGVDVEA